MNVQMEDVHQLMSAALLRLALLQGTQNIYSFGDLFILLIYTSFCYFYLFIYFFHITFTTAVRPTALYVIV